MRITLSEASFECGYKYAHAVLRNDYFWIGYFKPEAKRMAKMRPKDFAWGTKLAINSRLNNP